MALPQMLRSVIINKPTSLSHYETRKVHTEKNQIKEQMNE